MGEGEIESSIMEIDRVFGLRKTLYKTTARDNKQIKYAVDKPSAFLDYLRRTNET